MPLFYLWPMAKTALKLPTPEVVEQAQTALRALSSWPHKKRSRALRVQPDGGGAEMAVTVPKEAFELFLEVLGQMANGNAVTIVPVHAELTTQQAADLLNVSRPFLVGLLDEGKILYRLVGSHRRVKFADLMVYREAEDKRQREALDTLTAESQDIGLGY